MKALKPKDILESKETIVYREPNAMLNPPDEYKKKQGIVTQVNNNNRVIVVNRSK